MTDTEEFETMEREGWGDPAIATGYAKGFDLATRVVARSLANAVLTDHNYGLVR